MSNGKDRIKREGESLASETRNISDGNFSGPYVFISFDLINSTSYKSQSGDWCDLFDNFMEGCARHLKKTMPKAEAALSEWKRQGDEILFYLEYPDKKSLLLLPANIYRALEGIIKDLERYNRSSMVQLSAKATIWSAVVSKNSQAENGERSKGKGSLFNVATLQPTFDGKEVFDFLGPDIDTGFRIADYAVSGKLVIDAYLAWYITHCVETKQIDSEIEGTVKNIMNNMKIVSLENLKGIWYGRRYPIIWYLKEWKDYDDMFLYDEEYTSVFVKHIKERNKEPKAVTKYLEEILTQVNLLDQANLFANKIEEYEKEQTEGYERKRIRLEKQKRSLSKTVLLRLIAICKNSENNILIFKRSNVKPHFPNLWEFGCTYLKPGLTILESLKKGYKRKYNINLFVNKEMVPIGYSERPKGSSSITISELIYHTHTEGNIEPIYDSKDYSEYKWVSLDDAEKMNASEVVPDFHRGLKIV